ncbi:hypothetical protein ARMA_2486 [Ardenticatena maritima]|uniref:DUF7282 domain-containing protein n=1 Tax=Ardenticatena maritima TaxID=872965 RepID=A0A0M8K8M8_9CHLR|nr:LPXTG cell wall anchor domain-containing protein [Ardenticatena maritima]GAP64063.1 hypothetical protein ARMA_2486 [Ardenticatena maritima]
MKRLTTLLVLVAVFSLLALTPALAQTTPAVEVSDQVTDGTTVVVDRVVSDGQGWIVIHEDADGKPGPIMGFAQVQDGENTNVAVTLTTPATDGQKLWAMLHTDAGELGTWEFPDGPDAPVKVDDAIVMAPFMVELVGVEVSDQTTDGNSVVVDKVISNGQGWIVIHEDADGKPGPIMGFAQVQDGENTNVAVTLTTPATDGQKLWAMLHTDAGELGTWEFPDGPDAPVKVGDMIVMKAFTVSMAPATLPETGGASSTLPLLLTTAGLLMLVGAFAWRRLAIR